MRLTVGLLIYTLAFGAGQYAAAQDSADAGVPEFGGPDSVGVQLDAAYESWDSWKKALKDDHGFGFMVDYTGVLLSASGTIGSDTSSGGILRAFGDWSLTENGGLVWKFEHRHKYGSLSPFDFSLGSMGYVGLQEAPFNDSGLRVQNMYWRQRMNGGRSTLIAGLLDPTDYVDAFALASPWLHFMNLAFSTGSASIGLPNDGAWGAAFGTMLGDRFYAIAGLTDTNGDPTKPLEGLDTFLGDNEYFKSIEFGWTSSHERIIFDNAHVTFWHKDRQDKANVNSGWGMAFSFSRYLGDNFMPFIRGGYADDGGSLLQKSLSLGVGWETEAFDGLLGAAFNWGEPNEDTFSPGLDDQYAIELFYRVPFLEKFAVTFDTQLIQNPALNPDANTIWMFNLRARGAF